MNERSIRTDEMPWEETPVIIIELRGENVLATQTDSK
jgi:hypothetical protein